MTTNELCAALAQKYGPHLKNPQVAVLVNSFAAQVVYVGGEVERPSVVPLLPDMTTV